MKDVRGNEIEVNDLVAIASRTSTRAYQRVARVLQVQPPDTVLVVWEATGKVSQPVAYRSERFVIVEKHDN